MGTPHCGTDLADWARVGSQFLRYFQQVNWGTLEVLQHKSEVMSRIRQDFHTMLRERDQTKDAEFKIICFFEELPVWNIGMVF